MSVRLKPLSADSIDAWDAFVRDHPESTFCHRAGWKSVIEQGAGHDCPFLIAEQDGSIIGVLPLTVRKSALFGPLVVSNMFGVYGGPLAVTDEAYDALDCAAWDIAEKAGAPVLEYRTISARHDGQADWSVVRNKAATFIRDISPDGDDAILQQIPRKQRAVVRKSLKNDLTSDWNGTISEFYNLYALSVRNLGTPVFPRRLFVAFQNVFGKDVSIQVIRNKNGDGIASLMSFYSEDTVLPFYAGGGKEARDVGAHDYMYFELMKHAAARGIGKFDFGRSKVGTGPYHFKKNWGFEPTPLEYEFRLAPGAEIPDVTPQNKKYQLMIAAWKRLPLAVSKVLGPPIARHLG